MKAKITSTSLPVLVWIRDMQEGQLAKVISHGPYEGEIVLRVYAEVVSLSKPSHTWGYDTPLYVQPLPPGTVVELTSEV